jgi:hypothetical protein
MRRGLRHHVRYGRYRPYGQNFLCRCNNICANSQFWFTEFFMSAFISRAYGVRDLPVHGMNGTVVLHAVITAAFA